MSLLFQAELLKLSARPAARLALVALVLAGALGPLAQFLVQNAAITMNGEPLANQLSLSAPDALAWTLRIRGFYVAQVTLLLLASQSFAGELGARTLRDELVRPVRRSAVLAAKLGALGTFSLASLAGAVLVGALVGLVLLPAGGGASWGAVLSGAATTWLCELAFATFALAVSVLTGSVAGGLAAAFLFLLAERLVAFALTVAGWVAMAAPPQLVSIPPAVEWVLAASPFLPTSGWTAADAIVRGEPVVWQSWVALAGWTALSGALADRVFARSDVP
jgi:ABC-2 type transport system permease protein